MAQMKFSLAIRQTAYQDLINNTLGDVNVAKQFIADISSVVSNNYKLQQCEANSILSAGLMAQSLKLPLAQSLGFAYLVPYKDKAVLIIGYKGLIQLAIRSGQYKTIGVRPVHKGEWIGLDKHGEDLFKFDHQHDLDEVVGYYAWIELANGFEKTIYWTVEQCEKHGKRYSKSYGNGSDTDLWGKDFDTMSMKTVLKQLISKWGIMSVDIQKAVVFDQAIIKDDGTPEYVDNPEDTNTEVSDVNNHIIPQE